MVHTNKALNRLTISRQDFQKCRDLLAEIPAQKYGSIVYEGLLLSAIISYARPFSGNEMGKAPNAESRVDASLLDELTADERELHDLIVQLRNKAIAHAEWQYHPTNITKENVIKSIPFSIWKYFRDTTDIDRFQSLVEKVILRAKLITAEAVRRRP